MDLEEKKTAKYLVVDKQDLLDIIATVKPTKVWITSQEVKEILNISSNTTLQALRNKDLLDVARISSKLILYRRSSVLQLLEDKSSNKSR